MENIPLNLEQPWEIVKELMKENNVTLTDEDLFYNPDNVEKLLAHLSKKLNRSMEDVRILIESISANSGKAS